MADRQVVEQLVHEYGGRLYPFCRRLALSPADADDLYQQTYLRVLDMSVSIDPTNNPASFLMSVAARIWRDEQRKRARRQRIAPLGHDDAGVCEVPDDTLTESLVEQDQLRYDIRRAVSRLSEPLRVSVLLYYMADLPVEQIAKTLGIPKGTVKSRLHQARLKLKTELEGIGYGKQTG